MIHELLVALFRGSPSLAPSLLVRMGVAVPSHSAVELRDATLPEPVPPERRADAVLVLREGSVVCAVIVEVQLHRDRDKAWVWPVYVALVRQRERCPVVLLVVAPTQAIADWAREPIVLGPLAQLQPVVLGPEDIPRLSGLEHEDSPAVTVLAAMAHAAEDATGKLAERGIVAARQLDDGHGVDYADWIISSLGPGLQAAIGEWMKTNYVYQSEFAREYYARGREEGREVGREEGREVGREEGRQMLDDARRELVHVRLRALGVTLDAARGQRLQSTAGSLLEELVLSVVRADHADAALLEFDRLLA
ncbi:MAG: hypothetical protein KDC87_15430 [Planctomycetes bacterium]|nr:hypothetical protein [Planctomycetota bacterium]MCB9868618.1 hypothetical protein [Planctomycetota bacterium]